MKQARRSPYSGLGIGERIPSLPSRAAGGRGRGTFAVYRMGMLTKPDFPKPQPIPSWALFGLLDLPVQIHLLP